MTMELKIGAFTVFLFLDLSCISYSQVPGAPPQNVKAIAESSTSIQMSWEPPPPNRTNGEITYYMIFKVQADKSDSSADIAIVKNQTRITLDELHKWTKYRLWVLAGTAVGEGPTSSPITVCTLEDVPGPPTDVKVTTVNFSTLHVEWKPPAEKDRHGIRQYRIHVQETNADGVSFLDEPLHYNVQGGPEYNVTDLQPNTYYQIQVAALTRKGEGVRSTLVNVKTPGGVPSRPIINLKLTQQGQDMKLDIEWTKPSQTFGELTGYLLRYGIKDQKLINVTLKSTNHHYSLTNLERGAVYEFRLSGQNENGYGKEAISYIELPEGPPSGPPTNLTYTFQTPNVVCLKWAPPEQKHRNGQIIRYDIQFNKKVDHATVYLRNTTINQMVFSDLEEGTKYEFTVRAATKQGSGPWSEKVSFITYKKKTNVDGDHCDSCKPGTFGLQTCHKNGCLSCYCSGVSSMCQSSNFFVTQIPMPPLSEKHDFTLTTGNRDSVIKIGFTEDVRLNGVSYDYTTEREQELFWSLPSTFTGRKVTSYGGNLTWTQAYYAPTDAIPIYGDDVVIYGDGISIHWTSNVHTASNRHIVKNLRLVEHRFRRVTKEGTLAASRSDMLRVLSNIESILIRASYASQTNLVFIGDVSLDTAVFQPVSSIRASLVESCRCPTGYKGTSCEMCASGYYQVASQDGYVKECKKCPCNELEESCSLDPVTLRVVCKCQPGYFGEFCDGW